MEKEILNGISIQKERRNLIIEQTRTVTKLFAEYGIDLNLVEAGRTLYQSLRQAKTRAKTRPDYIKKGIKFMFNPKDRLALIELIQGDNEFWQAWINQNEIFKRTGLEDDRPTIHRIDSDGNYEFGNLAVLPLGEHLQEHAKPVIVLDTDEGKLTTHRSQKAFQGAENVSKHQVGKINKALEKAWSLRKEAQS